MFPIVGVGASAGGLEAFSELLSHVGADVPLAFVLIQHLAPTHASVLVDLLARTSRMPVIEVTDGMAVECGRVHVIPPNASMTVAGGVLHLMPRRRDPGPHMPIDRFLCSLAENGGSRAIGVILSGTASDGALGLRAVKAAGGLTFAQDTRSAKYSGMPHSAAISGAVDFVLPPRAIARELVRIGRHPHLRPHDDSSPDEETPAGGKALEGIFRILHTQSGVDFTHYRRTTIRRRIARRMTVHRIKALEDYRRFLGEHPDEAQALFSDLLIGVTGFFRDPGVFGALRRSVFPKLLKRRATDAPIRIWVPGCATGEEAYSVAMALLESLGKAASQVPVQVFATDVSETSIARARSGVYPGSIGLDVSPARLRRFFVKLDGHYQVRKSLRELCVFAQHNLARDPPFSNLDLISCRNVLIYLEPVLQRRVMSTLHYALKPSGVLLLGGSETIGPLTSLFTQIDRKHKLYGKKPTATPLGVGGLERVVAKATPSGVPTRGAGTGGGTDLVREADRIVLGRYGPAGVLVNDAIEIVQFRGRTSPYLEPAPGQATLNLLKMAREGLLMPLRQAIDQARKRRRPVRSEGLRATHDGTFARVELQVVPVDKLAGERHYLVLFEDLPPKAPLRSGKRSARSAPVGRRVEVEALRRELAAAKDYLQSLIDQQDAANEELRSANEEMLSINEELQSTNEELETAKEELQSVNEELTTLNEELQHRNTELSHLNDDLTNLIASVRIPTVILGSDLRIRRFTNEAVPLFNLVPVDLGRPLRDLRTNLELPDLEPLCTQVIDSATAAEREVRDRDGSWYQLRIRPYRTADNRITGAVMTLTNITALRDAIERLTAARDYAESIVDTVREPLLVLDEELRVMSASRAFYEVFRGTPQETIGRFLFDLGNGQWDVPALRAALSGVIQQTGALQDFELEHDFATIGRRSMLLNARQIQRAETATGTLLLAIEDVSARREADALRAARAAAEAANRAKDDFIAVLSHELRTPLNAILGWARVLRDVKLDPPKSAQGLEAIQRNAESQAQLLEGLLDVSRIATGKLELEIRPVDFVAVIEAAVEAARPAAEARGVRMEARLDPAAAPVSGDRERLQQIVGNLLSNAVKFTPTEGAVEVTLEAVESRARLVVRDTGQGIAPEFLPHLFERFSQAEGSTTRTHRGLGLGLAIVQHLVRLHGGVVRADSPGVGQGATFTVEVPRLEGEAGTGLDADPRPERAGEVPAAGEGPDLRGLSILVVEDEDDALELLAAVLREQGARVVPARTASEALDALERDRPDAIVSDIGLPTEDGYSLIRKVRARPPQQGGLTPAVALTAFAGRDHASRALKAGYQTHLAKPIDSAALLRVLATLTGRTGAL